MSANVAEGVSANVAEGVSAYVAEGVSANVAEGVTAPGVRTVPGGANDATAAREVARILELELPAGSVTTDPAALADVAADASGWTDGVGPAALVRPASVADVQRALALANAHRVPVVPRGAGTGLTGGASGTAGSIVLSVDRLTRIIEIHPTDGVALVEPGVITADVDAAARERGLFYAPDPASYAISTIGGNIATNAGGLRCAKYGVTRDSVLGLEVVLADGTLLNTGHRSIKGVTGLDLTGLFVGSEGTLGVVVGATLRLRPAPIAVSTLVAVFADTPAAAAAVAALAASPVQPAICELLGETAVASLRKRSPLPILTAGEVLLLVQTDGYAAAVEAEVAAAVLRQAGGEVHVAADDAEADELVDLRRSWGLDPDRRRLIGEDVAVPRSQLVRIVTAVRDIAVRHGLSHSLAAHAGDGNLHPSFDVVGPDPRSEEELAAAALAAADDLIVETLAAGGTITGEHGVGVLKRRWFADDVGQPSAALQRRIKALFDPNGILNPGKVY